MAISLLRLYSLTVMLIVVLIFLSEEVIQRYGKYEQSFTRDYKDQYVKFLNLTDIEMTSLVPEFIAPPSRPFDSSKPKFVLILAYQRVGSTMVGESMFGSNDRVLYTYEPLDSVYNKLYSTEPGWANPNDIHFHWNGTVRKRPKEESVEVARLIEQLFNCNYDNMITEYLVHMFWTWRGSDYGRCVKELTAHHRSMKSCRGKLLKICPKRIGENEKHTKMCFRELVLARNQSSTHERFSSYVHCVDQLRKAVLNKCVAQMKQLCKSRQVRAIKTVRLEMKTIEHLMDSYPNMRIIHLMRSPKPVVLSRIKADWAISGNANPKIARKLIHNQIEDLLKEPLTFEGRKDFSREAKMYCSWVLKDLKVRQEIEERYPGSTYEMLYENLLDNTKTEVKRVYSFLEEEVSGEVLKWSNGAGKSKASVKVVKTELWKEQITVKLSNIIDSVCNGLYEYVDFPK